MHQCARQYIPTDLSTMRPEWNEDLFYPKHKNTGKLQKVLGKQQQLVEQITVTPKTDFGLIHSDINFGNIKLNKGSITFLIPFVELLDKL